MTPLDCAAAAKEWRAAGATLIGGCCRMGPDHIAAMSEALRR
ncbi:MAG TPA: homocysteine S-methyltransferase family protein [Woeseiaceae bacterium]|nr:homocysteine S-methyltransferase family protein [Woeseiaceae bacterium]